MCNVFCECILRAELIGNSMAAPWSPSPQQASYYQQCFDTADMSKSGRIQGGEAVKFMMRSGVQPGILKEVRRQDRHSITAHGPWPRAHAQEELGLTHCTNMPPSPSPTRHMYSFPPLQHAPLQLVTVWTPRTQPPRPIIRSCCLLAVSLLQCPLFRLRDPLLSPHPHTLSRFGTSPT